MSTPKESIEKEVIDILKEAGISIGGWPLRMIS